MKNKRGLSEIVTAILIVVLVIIAILIIWAILKPMIKSGSEQVHESKVTILLDIIPADSYLDKEANEGKGEVGIKVKRQAGRGNLAGIKFIFHKGNERVIRERRQDEGANLQELEGRLFVFKLPINDIDKDNLEKVSIAPIIDINGKEVTGTIQETWIVQEGSAPAETKTIILRPNGDVESQTLRMPEEGGWYDKVDDDVRQPNEPSDGDYIYGEINGNYDIFELEDTNEIGEGRVSEIKIWAYGNITEGCSNCDWNVSINLGSGWLTPQNFGFSSTGSTKTWKDVSFQGENWEEKNITNLQVKMILVTPHPGGCSGPDCKYAYCDTMYAEITYS